MWLRSRKVAVSTPTSKTSSALTRLCLQRVPPMQLLTIVKETSTTWSLLRRAVSADKASLHPWTTCMPLMYHTEGLTDLRPLSKASWWTNLVKRLKRVCSTVTKTWSINDLRPRARLESEWPMRKSMPITLLGRRTRSSKPKQSSNSNASRMLTRGRALSVATTPTWSMPGPASSEWWAKKRLCITSKCVYDYIII